jgi:hypothetical protein
MENPIFVLLSKYTGSKYPSDPSGFGHVDVEGIFDSLEATKAGAQERAEYRSKAEVGTLEWDEHDCADSYDTRYLIEEVPPENINFDVYPVATK